MIYTNLESDIMTYVPINITKQKVMKMLSKVNDPELNISIVDMGFIYDIEINANTVAVNMTLTTIGCPLTDVIKQSIENSLMKIKGVDHVKINLVFDPPWSMDKMTKKGKALMGVY